MSKVFLTEVVFLGIIGLLSLNKPVIAAGLSVPSGYNISVFAKDPAGSGNPDSIAVDGDKVYVGYGDANAPDGSDGLSSQIVEYSLSGQQLTTFSVLGRNDGLRVDPSTHLLWSLSNEDGNGILTIINPQTSAEHQYNLPSPSLHGGGFDDLAFLNGKIFIDGSNPNTSAPTAQDPYGISTGPTLYTLTITNGSVQLSPVSGLTPTATVPLTDPDSLGTTPNGNLTMVSQQDKQLELISNPDTNQQSVTTLNLPQQVDDTVFAPTGNSFLLVSQTVHSDISDGGLGAIYKITGPFTPGTAFSAENANNQVGILDPTTGNLTSFATGILGPHGMSFVSVPEPITILGSITALGLGASLKRKLAQKKKDKNRA